VTSATLQHAIKFGSEIIPAGESLEFNANGIAKYNGKDISIYQIPSKAFTDGIATEAEIEDAHNAIPDSPEFTAFDKLEPGAVGQDASGQTVRFLGKGVGKSGYDALLGEFGDASGKTFDDLVVGLTNDEIDSQKFVAYTISDGTICIGLYGKDYAFATESDAGRIKPIAEVKAADAAVDASGKPVTILTKVHGKTYYDKIITALQIPCQMAATPSPANKAAPILVPKLVRSFISTSPNILEKSFMRW
jgi:hypothetical protein